MIVTCGSCGVSFRLGFRRCRGFYVYVFFSFGSGGGFCCYSFEIFEKVVVKVSFFFILVNLGGLGRMGRF